MKKTETVASWLKSTTARLVVAAVPSARLDALILLEDALGRDRSWLLAHGEELIDSDIVDQLEVEVTQRGQHIPLAYIRGKSAFYGRDFFVNEHTLVPRPESEAMISLFCNISLPQDTVVVDVGTGSGALGITAALEGKRSSVFLTDIDKQALATAQRNCQFHGISALLVHTDLLNDLPEAPMAILANLPYVPDAHTVNRAAMREPKHAIFGGPDGLDLYRRLFLQASRRKIPPTYILTEALPPQHDSLASIASAHTFTLECADGFIQMFKLTG